MTEQAAELDTSFARFAAACDALGATRSRLEKRRLIAEYLVTLDEHNGALACNYFVGRPFAESDRRTPGVGGSLLTAVLKDVTRASDAAMTAAYRRHGDMGDAAEDLYRQQQIAPPPTLTLERCAQMFDELAATGKRAERTSLLTAVLRAAAAAEAKYIVKILLGDMRTGVKDSMVEEAIAAAFAQPLEKVRRAVLYSGDAGRVFAAARAGTLAEVRMSLFHALGFMLASPVETAEEAFERLLPQVLERELGDDNAAALLEADARRTLFVEDKFDGMRAQIHCGDPAQPERVAIYSRNREDITAAFPELRAAFEHFPVRCILDGEVLGWDRSRERALPFATFSNRLGRKVVSAELLRSTPVAFMAFDLMLLGDDLLLDEPLHKRRAQLELLANDFFPSAARGRTDAEHEDAAPDGALFAFHPQEQRIEPARLLLSQVARPATVEELEAAFAAARGRGNEGLMVKDPDSAYTPGRRGLAWLKIKKELATLDVVITGAEFGSGKRAGSLSDYTFAVRDGERLRNVGKAYSGVTDAEVAHLSQWCMEHTVQDFGHFRTVDPQIILEVAFNNVMRSTRHDSGFALRFPRILRIRTDKPLEEIDSLERVEEVYQSQPDRPEE